MKSFFCVASFFLLVASVHVSTRGEIFQPLSQRGRFMYQRFPPSITGIHLAPAEDGKHFRAGVYGRDRHWG